MSVEKTLAAHAKGLGVSDWILIDSAEIVVNEELAKICRDEKCPGYGSGASCPPHVMSPARFRTVLAQYQSAFICKFDIPTTVLFGNERNDVLRLLHETVSSIRDVALEIGCAECMALAAGSCKQIFCADHDDCPVISNSGRCRYPRYACPSMSGLGIEVNRIMRIAGWDKTVVEKSNDPVSGMTGMALLKRSDENGSHLNHSSSPGSDYIV